MLKETVSTDTEVYFGVYKILLVLSVGLLWFLNNFLTSWFKHIFLKAALRRVFKSR
jgi:hypothetical protein